MNEELTKLIKQAISGDMAAFEKVMEKKARQVIYVCVKLLRNHQDGEDAAQEAMLKMYQHINELKEPEAFQGWMYQIITRTCIDMRRKQSRDDHDYLEEARGELNEMRREFLPQEYIEDVDKRNFLIQIIDELPEHYRACLLFFYYEDLSYKEIARAMGITEKRVDNILLQAKKGIKRRLEQKYEGQITFQTLHGLAAAPVLTQLFQLDAVAQTPPETVAKILSGLSGLGAAVLGSGTEAAGAAAATATASQGAAGTVATSTAAAGSASAATTTAAATGAAATGTLTVSAKIAIGLVATAAVCGGAGYGLLSTGGLAEELPLAPAGQEAAAILTLEDMIGTEAAKELKAFVSGEGSAERWQPFLEELGVVSISGAIAGDATYTLYHLERQDKQLMILEKEEEEALEIAWHFTERYESAPTRQDLVSSMEEWRR